MLPNQMEKNVLYFSDLPLNIIQKDLEMFLESYKDKIIVINLEQNPKNLELNKPLSAKVIFKDYNSANKCRLEMNLKKIKGHSVRIMWDEKDSSIRYNTKSNLYFKGVPNSISSRKVYEYFMKFGDISSLKLIDDENGNHLGYGYITYYNPDDAQKAILETNGKKVFDNNNIIEITQFQKRIERTLYNYEKEIQKIYINNFNQSLTENELNKICSKYGNIISCKIFQDHLGRNFAIVHYENQEMTNNALKNLQNDKELSDPNSKLLVEVKQNKFERKQYLENKKRETNNKLNQQYQMCNLHIRNIPLTATEEDLINAFSKYGNIKSVKIEKYILETKVHDTIKEIPTSKGFGYLCFDNPQSAKNAILGLNEKYLPSFESWNRPLLIEYFIPKAERQIMNNQMMNNNGIFYYNQNIMNNPNYNNYNYRGGYYNKRKNYNNNRNYNNNNNQQVKKEKTREIDMNYLNSLDNEDAKRDYLGEQIFKAIENSAFAKNNKMDFDIIGKITGMIIGIPDIYEVIEIFKSENILNSRIKEGYDLINSIP
jgi:polyadenylate-binding protein